MFIGCANLNANAKNFSYTATTYNQTTHETFVLGTGSIFIAGLRYA